MAVSLSASLLAHQRANARKPALSVVASAKRFGIEHPRWYRYYTGAEADAPSAVTVANDGAIVRARNNAGSLDYMRTDNAWSDFSTWTTIVAVTAGNAIALAANSTEVLLAYVDNASLTVKVRTSSDNGISWSAATAIVTEGAAISGMAAAYRPNGDACLFYCVGTNVKSLRRVAGTWAGAGTSWSRSGSVASLSGVAAVHDGGDFVVTITGTEVTTTHRRVWGAWMGDGSILTSNTWSGIVSLAEADALSTTTYAGPAVIMLDLIPFASFAHKESGNVAFNRAYTAHTASSGAPTGTWTEPAPHEATSAYGMAMAQDATGVWAVTPSGVWSASRPADIDLSARVLSATFDQSPFATRATVTFDSHDSTPYPGANHDWDSLYPGGSVTIKPGYASGTAGAAEYGVSYNLTVERMSYGIDAKGRATVTIEAVGPWEILSHWRAPQAWQTAAATLTRAALFKRLANRVGVTVNGTDYSSNWGTDKPAFAIAAGESGESVAARLFAVESSFVIPGSDFTYKLPTTSDGAAWGYQRPVSTTSEPFTALSLTTAPGSANWSRLQGPDRYADSHNFDWANGIYTIGPRLDITRSLDAGTDAKASAYAANAARRAVVLTEQGTLTCPVNAGVELLDVIWINDSRLAPSDTDGRIIRLRWRFERATKGPTYEATYTLGGR